MPIYEYRCPQCNGHFQKLVRGFGDPSGLACPRCGNAQVQRAISKVAVLKSEDTRTEALGDPSMYSGLDENDPRSIARWAKKLGKQLGEEVGDDWNEMVDQMLEEQLSDDAKKDKPKEKSDDLGWG